VEAAAPESDRNVEQSLIAREAIVRNIERMREGLAGYPVTLAMLELCTEEGVMAPAEVARRLGVPVAQVYNSQKQLLRFMTRLRGDGSDPNLEPVKGSP
jgi:hypothetical protein